MILHRLEREQSPDNIDFYFLDLIKYRELSHAIAAQFDVQHESPQILLIKNGKCIYNESHNGISLQALIAEAS
jgi:bacillithiol system protein YtxJ